VRYVDEFRDASLGRALAGEILSIVEPGRHYKVMEVCGGHTHSIYKYGLDDLLPANVELVHGPGCPVCVIPMGRVDDGIALAHQPGVIFTCFGDMMRVPGSDGSLLDAKAPAPTSAWSTRRSTRCGSPSPTRTARSSSSRSASRPPRRRPR
jgi:hydrogenase expression/formation protein HypD